MVRAVRFGLISRSAFPLGQATSAVRDREDGRTDSAAPASVVRLATRVSESRRFVEVGAAGVRSASARSSSRRRSQQSWWLNQARAWRADDVSGRDSNSFVEPWCRIVPPWVVMPAGAFRCLSMHRGTDAEGPPRQVPRNRSDRRHAEDTQRGQGTACTLPTSLALALPFCRTC